MNKGKLRAKCQKLSKETGLSFNAMQTHYFLVQTVSNYQNNRLTKRSQQNRARGV